MTTFDQFAVTDGSVTADPADGSAPVTFDAALVDRHDDGTAGWEPLVADWLDAGDGSISFDADGSAALSSDRVLSATEASSAVAVGDRRGAEAVLAYLAHEGVVGVDDDSVTVLRPFEEVAETHTAVYNNWAATVDVLVDRVDVLSSRIEAVEMSFDARDDPTAMLSVDPDSLSMAMERYSLIRDTLFDHIGNFRQLALDPTILPESLVEGSEQFAAFVESSLEELPTVTELATTADRTIFEIVERIADQYAGFLSSFSSTFSPSEKMADLSPDEFMDEITESESSDRMKIEPVTPDDSLEEHDDEEFFDSLGEHDEDVGGSDDSADDPSDAN
ncbi:hypothetical protein [Halobaculum sp. MBLA0143]|uniref:hypothetical protein n=1 Tax=Halobaculum sp. MBLA0143 TaxID=3079933 RepID=UPI003524A5DD